MFGDSEGQGQGNSGGVREHGGEGDGQGPLPAILDFEASDWLKYKECSDQKTYLAKVARNGQ